MKKIIFSAIVFICFFFQSYAQVTFGIKGAIGVSPVRYANTSSDGNEYHDHIPNKSLMLVPSIYGIVTIPISETFLIRIGIGFDQQAFSYRKTDVIYSFFNNNGAGVNFTTNLNSVKCRLTYLEIPVYVSLKLPFAQRKFDVFCWRIVWFKLRWSCRN